jgi:lycopene cyclase CruA
MISTNYPRTYAAFEQMGALDHLERVLRLDSAWAGIRAMGGMPQNDIADDVYRLASAAELDEITRRYGLHRPYDLIYAGSGLGLLHAAVMARCYGLRILIFDRGEVGCAHREWNITRSELQSLVDIGFCSWADLDGVIMREYRTGLVQFHDATKPPVELWMPNVLNLALDAGALLRLARRILEQSGGIVLDQRAFRRVLVAETGAAQVVVELERESGAVERHRGKLLIDGMGSASPLALHRFSGAPFAGVCPTVGTVAEGFVPGPAPTAHDPEIGDILLTIANAQRGQQYMWEGFPGRGDELTVYLFYYDTLHADRGSAANPVHAEDRTLPPNTNHPRSRGAEHPTLLELFEDYFHLLPNYKPLGPDFRHLKPVYGYIPARHSLRRQEVPLLRGVVPIGDSAAQQSPLTFCGFGSHVRNLGRTTSLLRMALRDGLTEPAHLGQISSYQVNVSLNWVFSRFMQPWGPADGVNKLQNHFLAVLNSLGVDLAERFFRDRMRWSDYHRMILGMFWRYPQIALIAWRVLGPTGVQRWIADYLGYCAEAMLASIGRRLGARGRLGLIRATHTFNTTLSLFLRARFAEWDVMGWL